MRRALISMGAKFIPKKQRKTVSQREDKYDEKKYDIYS
jgi:hypothetical protein